MFVNILPSGEHFHAQILVFRFMIDIQQLTSLISAFRLEIEYNIIRFWKETKGSTVSSMTSSSATPMTTAWR